MMTNISWQEFYFLESIVKKDLNSFEFLTEDSYKSALQEAKEERKKLIDKGTMKIFGRKYNDASPYLSVYVIYMNLTMKGKWIVFSFRKRNREWQ